MLSVTAALCFIMLSGSIRAAAADPATGVIARTGQTNCYGASGSVTGCDNTGQDGELQTGQPWPEPRFTAGSGDEAGCVTDHLTGLMWPQDGATACGKNWAQALDLANGLARCGHDDWRLPNLNELKTLASLGNSGPVADWLNTQGFTNLAPNRYWSSTTFPNSTDHAWYVELRDGYTHPDRKYVSFNEYCALPVRDAGATVGSLAIPVTGQSRCYDIGGYEIIPCDGTGQDGDLQEGVAWPEPRFTVAGDCVTDGLTGLVWPKNGNPAGGAMTWSQALEFANNLSLCDHEDWRLPNATEIGGFMHAGVPDLASWLNGAGFEAVQGGNYWSSTTAINYPAYAWFVALGPSYSGRTFYNPIANPNPGKESLQYVWPVRGGAIATFHSVTPSAGPHGTIAPDTIQPVLGGATVAFTVTPENGYHVAAITGTCPAGSLLGWTYITGAITADCTVVAEFAINTYMVTGTAGDHGAITCTSPVEHGATATCSLTPEPGFHVDTIAGCGAGALADNIYTSAAVTGDCTVSTTFAIDTHTLTVARTGTGTGTVTGMPGGIDCGVDCEATFEAGTPVTLTAQPAPPAIFRGWQGCNFSSGPQCSVTMNRSREVTALFSLPAAGGGAVTLPQTGQTRCYDVAGIEIACTGTGQDGESRAGGGWPAPRFAAGSGPAAECVTDRLTGLTWAGDGHMAGSGRSWQGALDYIVALNSGAGLCGHNDWRLPNINELESLVHADQPDAAAWLATRGFSFSRPYDTRAFLFWSATTMPSGAGWAFFIDLNNGDLLADLKTSSHELWPVRGGQEEPPGHTAVWRTGTTTSHYPGDDGDLRQGVAWPAPRFTDNGDGTVSDTLTGLIWLQDGGCFANRSWDQALADADILADGQCALADGSTGGEWRLPNRKELLSLIDRSANNPALPTDHPFGEMPASGWYWSSTSQAGDPLNSWLVGMRDGVVIAGVKTDSATVWPVRAGGFGLVVAKSGSGTGLVTSSPPGLECGEVCTRSFGQGEQVTLTASPLADSIFEGWEGCEPVNVNQCAVTLDRAGQVTARFKAMGSTGAIELAATGQTGCFDGWGADQACVGTGQDGDLRAGAAWPAPRFIDNGDETLTDRLTGLIWPRDGGGPVVGQCDRQDGALTYIGCLNAIDYLGHGDWRLPNINELESLVNGDEPDMAAWLGMQGFANVWPHLYWSSTATAADPGRAWVLFMTSGFVLDADKDTLEPGGEWPNVWPVRGGQTGAAGNGYLWRTGQTESWIYGDDGDLQKGVAWPSPRFCDNGDGTVTDRLTGLIWLKDAGCTGLGTWEQSLIRADGLAAGQCGLTDGSIGGDWRLPNRKELFSLIDRSQFNPALPPEQPFANVQPLYWSSTSYAGAPGLAWNIVMVNGTIANHAKTNSGYAAAWPVRGGTVNRFSLTVTRAGTGNGSVAGDNGVLECGEVCARMFGQGTTVVLTATPGSDAIFDGWSGCDATDGEQCTVTMTRAHFVTAHFSAMGGAGLLRLPRTGQAECYDSTGAATGCPGTGQDGDHRAGAPWPNPRFTANGACVTDTLTGLTWAQNGNLAEGARSWQQSLDYLASLNSKGGMCGHGDWRLPNINELESLVHLGQPDTAAWLNSQGFNNVRSDPYWSSTASYVSVLVLFMADGTTGSGAKSNPGYLWPVRGEPSSSSIAAPVWKTGVTTSYAPGDDGDLEQGVAWPEPRFTDNLNGTVRDNLTGLIWLADGDCFGDQPWDQALARSLTLGAGQCGLTDGSGAGDWRLANRKELFSLFDWSNTPMFTGYDDPALPTGHPFDNVRQLYWSSSSAASQPANAWLLDMLSGTALAEKTTAFSMWPVRAGGVAGELRNLTIVNHGAGSVAASPAGASCGSDCISYPSGTTVVLTATADSGSGFGGWQGCDLQEGTRCTVTMDNFRRVEANFAAPPAQYYLSIAKIGPGNGTITSDPATLYCGAVCDQLFAAATKVVLMATGGSDSAFGGWNGCDQVSGNRCTVAMTGNRTVTAIFGPRLESVTLPQSGTSRCYDSDGLDIPCGDTGQDGDLRAGAPWPATRFTVANECVTDNLTGLMWTADTNPAGGERNWAEALDYVASLNRGGGLCGYDDWRLPNINELESMIHLDNSYVAWLGRQGFDNLLPGNHWSSTTSAADPRGAWVASLCCGFVGSIEKTVTGLIWPVRGGQFGAADNAYLWKTGQTASYGPRDDGDLQQGVGWPSPRFNDNGDGTVLDNLTGLVWLKDGACLWRRTRDEALAESGSLEDGRCGLTDGSIPGDWRLPNRKELLSLIDWSEETPALPASRPFSYVQPDFYWSSSDDVKIGANGITGGAWVVDLASGVSLFHDPATLDFVWPVRAGALSPGTQLTVTRSGAGSGMVTASPDLLFRDNETAIGYPGQGTVVTLAALPEAGSLFAGWSGDCSGTGVCQVTMEGITEVMATFDLDEALTVVVTGGGRGEIVSDPAGLYCTATCSHPFAAGSPVTLTATAEAGSTFGGWSGCATVVGDRCTVTAGSGRGAVHVTFDMPDRVARLPRTGQTGCYDPAGLEIDCAATGQDGEFRAGAPWLAPRFAASGDCLTDTLTGLTWLGNGDLANGKMTWPQALEFIAALNDTGGICGHTDWRLPNINELESLVNAEVPDQTVWLNEQGLIEAQPDRYWSSSTMAPFQPGGAWCLNLLDGGVEWNPKEVANYLWPVRGGAGEAFAPAILWATGQTGSFATGDDGDLEQGVAWPSPRFSDNLDGTVTDNLTGLVWLRDANCLGRLSWAGALAETQGLAAGQCDLDDGSTTGGWRLPNRKELLSLLDRSAFDPALPPDHPFLEVRTVYWSSTTVTRAGLTSRAWTVDLRSGGTADGDKDGGFYAWPVRGGVQAGGPAELVVALSGDGEGEVTVDSGTIVWDGRSGTASYASGTMVTLTASPGPGSLFTGWSGACTATEPCRITMDDARFVAATFVRNYPLTVNGMGPGSGRITSDPVGIDCGTACSGLFASGTGLTLTAMPAADAAFAGWLGCDSVAANQCFVTMTGPRYPSAIFVPLPEQVRLPRTGQTDCTDAAGLEIGCTGTGQDGDVMAGVPWPEDRFTPSGDCLIDNLTGLMWVKSPDSTIRTHGESRTHAANLDLCGYTDWRLPNVNELKSLLHPGVPNAAIWLNSQGFVDVQPGWHWAATTAADHSGYWSVDLWRGLVYKHGWSSSDDHYTLPVRGNGSADGGEAVVSLPRTGGDEEGAASGVAWPAPRFIDHGDGTVNDQLTGLTWLKEANCLDAAGGINRWYGSLSWPEALTWSNNLASGICGLSDNSEAGDWRLPNRAEMASLIDYGRYSPALPADHPFTNVQWQLNWYWTATTNELHPREAWAVGMAAGLDNIATKTTHTWVWPVRGSGHAAGPVELLLSKTGDGQGHISPDRGLIAWTGDNGAAGYELGTLVTLTAWPEPGSTFAGWSGVCIGLAPCRVTMDKSRAVAAIFTLGSHTVDVLKTGDGTGQITADPGSLVWTGELGTASYTHGTIVTLTPLADPGSAFVGWSSACVGDGACQMTVDGDKWVIAEFQRAQYNLSVTKEGVDKGRVTSLPEGIDCGATCAAGFDRETEVTLTVTPEPGFSVVWQECDYTDGNQCMVHVGGDKTVGLHFRPIITVGLPATGQDTCYGAEPPHEAVACAATGQDGDHRAGVEWPSPRFEAGAGPEADCLTDRLTGLVWLQNSDQAGGGRTWHGALDYVETLNSGAGFCGHNDWRLPNLNELESLIHAGQADSAAWLNTQGFGNVRPEFYWSSTTSAGSMNNPWIVEMRSGAIALGHTAGSEYVWPVRGGESGALANAYVWKTGQTATQGPRDDGDLERGAAWPSPRFADHNDGTVTDELTGLRWLKNGDCFGGREWRQALALPGLLGDGQCGLTDGSGPGDWRLANRKELLSLIDRSREYPALAGGHPFVNVVSGYYWSATTYVADPARAWPVHLGSGFTEPVAKAESHAFWPVRDGTLTGPALPGDVDGNRRIDLLDLIRALRLLTLGDGGGDIYLEGDVNNDGRIGLEEIVYLMGALAGLP